MKPYESYEGNNLTNIIPKEIAIVPAGANKKKIFLCKFDDNPKQGTQKMKKETALKLIKAGGLSDAEVAEILASCADADKVDVQKAIDAAKAPANTPGTVTLDEKSLTALTDVLVEKVGKALSKDSISKLTEIASTLKSACDMLTKMCDSGKGADGADGETNTDGTKVKKIDVSKIADDKDLSDEEIAALAESVANETETK